MAPGDQPVAPGPGPVVEEEEVHLDPPAAGGARWGRLVGVVVVEAHLGPPAEVLARSDPQVPPGQEPVQRSPVGAGLPSWRAAQVAPDRPKPWWMGERW